MRLVHALVSLALAMCASTAIAAVPNDAESTVLERFELSHRTFCEWSEVSEVFERTTRELSTDWHASVCATPASPAMHEWYKYLIAEDQEEVVLLSDAHMLIQGHHTYMSNCSRWGLQDRYCCVESDALALCGRPPALIEGYSSRFQFLELAVYHGRAITDNDELWGLFDRACGSFGAYYQECSRIRAFDEVLPWYTQAYRCIKDRPITGITDFGDKQTVMTCVRAALDLLMGDESAVSRKFGSGPEEQQYGEGYEESYDEIHNEVRALTMQKTVTASPYGTTTVFEAGMLSTITKDLPGTMQPQNFALARTGSVATELTTAIEHTTITTIVNMDHPEPTTTYATLTNPINPNATSYVTEPSSSCEPNTSVDTNSYVDISTFSASGLSTYSSSTSPIKPTLRSAIGGGTILASKTGAFVSITGTSSATTAPLPGPSKPMSTTMTLGSLAHAGFAWEGSGANVVVMMGAGMGACFVLALFL